MFYLVPGNSISVAPHAKGNVLRLGFLIRMLSVSLRCLESFGMGKIHKDIAMQMVQAAANDDTTEQALIKVRVRKRSLSTCTFGLMIVTLQGIGSENQGADQQFKVIG
jgi:hypothetical protein